MLIVAVQNFIFNTFVFVFAAFLAKSCLEHNSGVWKINSAPQPTNTVFCKKHVLSLLFRHPRDQRRTSHLDFLA